MNKKLLFILSLTVVSLYFCVPTFVYFSTPKELRNQPEEIQKRIPALFPERHVKLGLDLQGGVQLVLGVDTAEAVLAKLGRIVADLNEPEAQEQFSIESVFVDRENQELVVSLPDNKRSAMENHFGQDYPFLRQAGSSDTEVRYEYTPEEVQEIRKAALEQAERIVRVRVDKWGVAEPLISRRFDGSILVQLPGYSDPSQAKDLLGRTARLEMRVVDDQFDGFDQIAEVPSGVRSETAGSQQHFIAEDKEKLISLLQEYVPEDRQLVFEETVINPDVPNSPVEYRSYVVEAVAKVTGEDVQDASISRASDVDPNPAVSLRLTASGGKRFGDLTGDNVGRQIAILLDETVVSAPNVNQKIPSGQAVITLGQGGYNELLEEAQKLSLILKSGSIPAKITVLEERQVGASLGPELAQMGVLAIALGLAMIFIYMIIFYRVPGIISCGVILLNGIFMLTVMTGFGFAITLPGIAGFILTLGMAVDANVLINERIRQELSKGKNAKKSLLDSFDKVFWTIVDANVTTLIAAIVLIETNSSGPIKGFALTLLIGLSVSMFTSLYCTKAFFVRKMNKLGSDQKIKAFFGAQDLEKKRFQNLHVLRFSKPFSIFGVVMAVAVVGYVYTNGLNWSVDFAGGTELELQFAESIDANTLRGRVEPLDLQNLSFQALGSEQQEYLLRFDKLEGVTGDELSQESSVASMEVVTQMQEILKDYGVSVERIDFVGPQIGKELRTQGILSVIYALLGVFIYIGLRFDLRFAPGAIIKMIHDVMWIVGFYAFFWRSFDLTSVAAILTVVGYSVNDAIVIFDRIRENMKLHPSMELPKIINNSIRETLSRTINTSITTIFALAGVLILSNSIQLWNFAAAMTVGVVVATLSSTLLATGSVLWFSRFESFKFGVVQEKKKPSMV